MPTLFEGCTIKDAKTLGAVILMIVLLAGCSDLTPTFEEVRVVKAGDSRTYAIYTTTDEKNQMEKYARKKEWVKGAKTIVYFFSDRLKVPAKSYLGDDLPNRYREHLTATYVRHPAGEEEFLAGVDPIRQRAK